VGDVAVGKGDAGGSNTLNTRLQLPCVDGHCHLFGSSLTTADRFHEWSQDGQVVIVLEGTNGATSQTFPPSTRVKTWKFVTNRAYGGWVPNYHTLKARSVAQCSQKTWPPAIGKDNAIDLGVGQGVILDIGLARSDTKLARLSSFASKYKGLAHAAGIDGDNADVCLRDVWRQDARACVSLLLDLGYTPLPLPNVNAVLWAAGLTPRCMPDPDGFYPPGKNYFWGKREGLQYTVEALAEVAARFPGEVWAFVPFDPRRAVCPPKGESRTPLQVVQYALEHLGFAGVKLYTRCGWMPMGNRLLYPDKGDQLDAKLHELYRYLCDKDVPVLNHTSPTGFPPAFAFELPLIYHQGHPDIPSMPARLRPGEYTGSMQAEYFAETAAWLACIAAANYCHYIQNTVSPYAWEPVLKDYPKLRLCFAHSGGRVSAVAKFVESKFDPALWDELQAEWGRKAYAWDNVEKDWTRETGGPIYDLYTNPCVASGKWFKDELFRRCCHSFADDLLQGKLDVMKPDWSYWNRSTRSYEMLFAGVERHSILGYSFTSANELVSVGKFEMRVKVLEHINALLKNEWAPWLNQWAARYPLDWYSKIIELYKNPKYPNLYSDIAYYSGEEEKWFTRLLKPFVEHARKDPKVAERTIFGTDWWMTEMDGISPRTFWRWVEKVLDDKEPMWTTWTTYAPLNYLNLEPRMPTMESWFKKCNPSAQLPVWWSSVKKYYEQKRAKSQN
jgi:hypothetical protein